MKLPASAAASDSVTYHDPCYLGRYARQTEEPRALLERVGATVIEPVRNKTNPFCCGAGGGLLFEEHEEGKRISQERFEQLQATGAETIVMSCPFCAIMLKGAQASSNASTQMVDSDDLRERPHEERRRGCAGLHARRDSVSRAGRRGLTWPTQVERADWRASRSKRLQAALIPRVAYPLIATLGRTFRWRIEGAEHYDRVIAAGRQPIMAFWHGRILPATVFFQRRGIVVITSANFDGEWIARIIERFGYGVARGSTSRGATRALVQLRKMMADGEADGVHDGRTARAGEGGAAGRGVPGEDHRQSDRPVPHRVGAPLDRAQLGSDAGAQAVLRRGHRDRRAVRGRGSDVDDAGLESRRVALEAGARGPRRTRESPPVGAARLIPHIWRHVDLPPGSSTGKPA